MRLSHARNTLGTGVVLICLLLAGATHAQSITVAPPSAPPAHLVEDVDAAVPSDPNASPGEFVALGTTTYFVAEDDTNGVELWKTDGTTAGTALVRDITPGPRGSLIQRLTAVNGALLFFITDNDTSATTLWRSDGTAQGTTPVTAIPGSITQAAVVNGAFVYTTASSGGVDIYRSDGTATGTMVIKTLTSIDSAFVVAGTSAFFAGADSATGSELWKTDGTAADTTLVHDIVPGSAGSSPTQLTAVGANIFFTAATLSYDRTLWKSDGSDAGTTQVSASDGTTFRGLNNLVAVDNQLFFWSIRTMPFPPTDEVSLWKSDGTTVGTIQVKIVDTSDDFDDQTDYHPATSNHKLFFAIHGALWVSDGTEAGTTVVKTISKTINNSFNYMTDLNGTLFFAADDGSGNLSLWKSNGSEVGTVPVTSGTSSAMLYNPRELAVISNHLFLSVGSSVSSEPWISDGTSAGTFQLKNINAGGVSSFMEWEQQNGAYDGALAGTVAFKGSLFFSASDYNIQGNGPSGLWKNDGSVASNTLVKAFSGNYSDKYLPFNLTVVGDTLFFATNSVGQGWSLWKSDGTEGGTVVLKHGGTTAPFQYPLNQFVSANGKLFFVAIASGQGYALWQSDGTSDGTKVVKVGSPTDPSASLRQLTVVGNTLFFIITMQDHDELWKTDGTDAGTAFVKQFDRDDSLYEQGRKSLIAVGSTLFLLGLDAAHGAELWKSDGTEAGTTLVKDINPGVADSNIFDFAALNNTLYFTANDGVHGSALWKSDGTSAGTVLVSDINPDTSSMSAATVLDIQSFGNTLLFLGNDGVHGYELWKSDGTAAGTTPVKSFVPGPNGSLNYSLLVGPLPDGKRALINAYTPDKGIELWVTDGTPNGTILVQDIAPGAASSAPATFTTVGNQIFFTADDTVHGRELWALDADDVPTAQTQVFLPIVIK